LKLGIYSSGWSAPGAVQFGASDFWRLAVPARELQKHGWDVVAGVEVQSARSGELILKDERGSLHDGFDVVMWQRWMGRGAVEAILRAKATGQTIVNDVDDFYDALPRSNMARANTDPSRNSDYNRDIYREVIKASSLVTVSTPFLAKALERWGPPIRVVPNYIALDKWKPRLPGEYVGWVGVIPWRGADLQILQKAVVPWLRERKLPFYHGGHVPNGPPARDILQYDYVIERDAVPLMQYPSLWRDLKISLIPLDGSPFSNAKSAVKGIESMARGIPFIASDHPAYRDLGAKRLAKRPWEWRDHLDALQDPEVYAQECVANRANAESLDIALNWQAWDTVFREAISR
jgi:glycosyltransferase involved in cell wall biosynthesis